TVANAPVDPGPLLEVVAPGAGLDLARDRAEARGGRDALLALPVGRLHLNRDLPEGLDEHTDLAERWPRGLNRGGSGSELAREDALRGGDDRLPVGARVAVDRHEVRAHEDALDAA